MSFKNISVIGLGYIGLPTAAVFASRKIKVVGVDVNEHAVATINRGEIHIVEPELDIVVKAAVTEGYLRATTTAEAAEAFLIAVPTPFQTDTENGIPEPDLSYIQSAANAIAPVLDKGNLVILESTSPVGATEKMADWLAAARPDLTFPQTHGESSDIRIAHCPERVLPGHVIRELVENDRVIGGMTAKCSQAAVELYKVFVDGDCVITNARTAEMAKLTENSFRDVNIAFANELSIICDKLNINVWELIELSNRHPRVNILQPGPGVGGHCIAVDPWFIVSSTPEEAKIIHIARKVNDAKPQWIIKKVEEAISAIVHNTSKTVNDVIVTCFGIAFKPDIDDLRESPALDICSELAAKYQGQVNVVEPNIKQLPEKLLVNKSALISLERAVTISDVIVMLVDHREFKSHDFNILESQYLIDSKGIWL